MTSSRIGRQWKAGVSRRATSLTSACVVGAAVAALALTAVPDVAAEPLPDIPGLRYRATFVPNTQPASRPVPSNPDRLPDIPPILGPPTFGPPTTVPAPASAPARLEPGNSALLKPQDFAEDEALVRAAAAYLPKTPSATRPGDAAATNPSGEAPPAATRPAASQPAASPPPAAVGPVATRPAWWLAGEPPARESTRAARRILTWDPFADDDTSAAAVAVLVAHDWSSDNRELVVKRIARLPDLRPTAITRLAAARAGPALVDTLLDVYAWGDSGYDSARVVLRRLEAADPSTPATTALTRALNGPRWDPRNSTGMTKDARQLAVRLLDHADDGPTGEPRPLSPVAVAAVRELLYNEWSETAATAADVLLRRRLISGADWELLRDHAWNLLNSSSMDKRVAAAQALAAAVDKPVIAEAVIRALRIQVPWFQRTIVRALRDRGPKARAAFATPLALWLGEMASKPEPAAGPDVFGSATEQDVRDAGDAFDNATALLLRLEPLPADLMPSFGVILASSGKQANGEMLLAAGGLAALPTLDDLYQRHKADADPAVVTAVVRVLSQPQLAGPAAEDRLLAIFAGSAQHPIRIAAADGLARTRFWVGRSRQALVAELATDDLALRAAVASALATLGPGRDVQAAPAADLVRRGTPEQRAAGAKLLGAIGGRALGECAADLAQMADNVNPVVRWSAAAALTQVDAGGAYTGRAVVAAVRYQDSYGLDKLLGSTGLGRPSPAAVRIRGDRRTMLALKSLSVDHPNPAVRQSAEDAMDRIGE